MPTIIALDAMGADRAPKPEVEGAILAARHYDVEVVLVGREEAIQAELELHRFWRRLPISIVSAREVIGMQEKAAQAVRSKRDSSMRVGLRMVRDGKAAGFVTAGNTGAAMATAKMVLGAIPGVDRPALAAVFPTAQGTATILIDVGANVDSKPQNLQQFAIMGDVYFRTIFAGRFPSAEHPRVGVLSIGEDRGLAWSPSDGCHRDAQRSDVHSVFLRIRSRIRLPRRLARRDRDAQARQAAEKRRTRQRGHWWQPNRYLSIGNSGRLEIDRPHSLAAVSPSARGDELARDRRPRAVHPNFRAAIRKVGIDMRVVEVLSPGLFTTVQDLGRDGFGPLGISPSGAADRISLRIGNRLVGNPENSAGLEMTLVGGLFRFPHGAIVALTGSNFSATLDGAPLPLWTSAEVRPGQTIRFGDTRSGARCYLCVDGGIKVTAFLGSSSTHVLTGLGGFEGRTLRKGDVLEIGAATESFAPRRLSTEFAYLVEPRKTLRVTEGPQSDWFLDSSRDLFYSDAYRVSEQSNRLGLRLSGQSVAAAPGKEMITEGVSIGAIQIPPNGQPIIVFVDQQTTGGYPKIANVISADLDPIGQLRPP